MMQTLSSRFRHGILPGLMLACALCCSAAAQAGSLETWRSQVATVRELAENDAPAAYREVRRLQVETPVEVTSEDQVRMFNLRARIELYLGLIEESAQHSAAAHLLAKQNNDPVGQIEADLVVSSSAINQGRLEDMKAAVEDAMNLLEGVQREDLRAEVMFHVAMMYLRFAHQDEAAAIAMQTLDIAKRNDNPLARAYAEQGVAVAYSQSGLYELSYEHYRNMQDAARLAHSRLLEAAAVLGMSELSANKNNFVEAIRVTTQALELFRQAGAPLYVAHAAFILADQNIKANHLGTALGLLDEDVALYEKHNNPIGLWWTLIKRSYLLQTMGNLGAARKDAERANELAQKVGVTVYQAGSARRLADMAAAEGQYRLAYRYSAEAARLNDKLESEKAGKRIRDLSERFQRDSKQRQIDALTLSSERQQARQNQLWTVLVASLVLLTLTAFFVLRLRRSSEEIRKLNIGLEQRVQERTEELQQSRESLFEAQRIAHVGSWEMNLVDNILTWSDEIYRIFEIERGEFGASYEAFMETVHPEDRQLLDAAYKSSLEQHRPFDLEHRLLLPDGRIKFVHERCETIYDAAGKPLRSIGTVQDISERKEMENALRESRQLMAEAQRIAQVGSWEYDIVNDVHIWSDELFRIYEIDPMQDGPSYEGCMNATHPDDREAVANAYLSAVETGRPYESEHRLLMQDGRIKYVHERGETVCGADGRLLRAVGMMQDITARKKLEEALAAHERELRALAESSPGMMGSFYQKPDGTVCMPYVSSNIYEQFGVRPEEVVEDATPLLRLNHPDDAQRVRDSIAESARTMRPWHCEYRIIHPLKGERWMEGNTNPHPHPKGGVVWYGYVLDITERKRMEEALKESEARYRYNYNLLQTIIESPSDSVAIYAIDRDYRLLAFNSRFRKAAKRLWNAEIEPGMSMLDAIDTDEHRTVFKQGADHVLAGNHGYLESTEERIEDGKPVREYHDNFGAPIHGDHGEVIGMTIFVLNTTERKEVEVKLKEALEFTEGVINAIPDILFEMDSDGRYLNVWTHTPELLAAQKDVLLGRTVGEILPPAATATMMDALREAGRRGVSFGKTIVLDRSGSNWFELSVSQKAGGTFLVLSRDISARKKMEIALSESEAKHRASSVLLKAVLESSPEVIVFALDRDYRYLTFNERHRETMRAIWGKDIAFGTNMLDVIGNHSDRETARHGFDRALAGEAFVTEDAYGDERLSRQYWQNYFSPILGSQGEIIGLTCFVVNITKRKILEEKLALREQEFRSLAESSPDVIVRFDRECRRIYANRAAALLSGSQAEAMLGETPADRRVLSASYAEKLLASIRHVFASGKSEHIDLAVVFPDGSTHEYDSFIVPEFGADGQVATVLNLARDITERKRMEAQLEDSRNFLDSVIDAVPDPIFVKDRQHRWMLLNNAFYSFIGHPRGTLLGKSDYEIFPRIEADEFWAKDEIVFGSGEVNLNEEAITSADGVTHHIQTKKTPFVASDGKQMLVGVIRDISARKQYEAAREAALVEAQRLADLRSEFIAHMSHELRTPLNGILGYAQMLERDGKLDSRQFASMEVIRQSGEHLLALIEDILDLARIESGRLELDSGDIPLHRLLNGVAGIIGVKARQKNLDLVCEFASDLPDGVRGDERRLRQVLLNLLSNAVKFTGQGKVVLKVGRVSPSRLAFSVSDTGVGISAADRERIFQSFEQVGEARGKRGGTGLGLTISRQLVRLMGGDITVESHPGDGSTFRFELELPTVKIEPELQHQSAADMQPGVAEEAAMSSQQMPAPPPDEIRELHRLALLGNMRDIVQKAGHIAALDARYQPFAEHLKRLAGEFQSQAILNFVEGFLP